jgi:hypothetical protein
MEITKVKTENEELADNEEFRDIEGFEGEYQISNYGRVYSLISKKFLKFGKVGGGGYSQVSLYKEDKKKNYYVHRLVANAFIPNPLNLPQVNHKDENPSNNHVFNLEWCDASYNINYGSHTERMLQHPNWKASHKKVAEKQSKSVQQFTKNGEFVAEYPSVHEAERQTSINNQNISSCCNGKRCFAGGFVWRHKEEVA